MVWCRAIVSSQPPPCPAFCFRLQPRSSLRVFMVWLRGAVNRMCSRLLSGHAPLCRPLALRDSALLQGRCAAVCSRMQPPGSKGFSRVKCRMQPGSSAVCRTSISRSRQCFSRVKCRVECRMQSPGPLSALAAASVCSRSSTQPPESPYAGRSCSDSYVLCHRAVMYVGGLRRSMARSVRFGMFGAVLCMGSQCQVHVPPVVASSCSRAFSNFVYRVMMH